MCGVFRNYYYPGSREDLQVEYALRGPETETSHSKGNGAYDRSFRQAILGESQTAPDSLLLLSVGRGFEQPSLWRKAWETLYGSAFLESIPVRRTLEGSRAFCCVIISPPR